MIAVPVILLLTVIAVVTVVLVGRANTRARAAEKRLARAETLIDTLRSDAAQHVALGDNYAQIVMDEIRHHDTANRKELA